MTINVLCVVGTRPEVIKMAPVVHALRAAGVTAPILATGQHRDLLDQALRAFGLEAAWDLNVMRPNQALADVTGRLLPGLASVFREARPNVVLAQGDTTTVFATSLAAFFAGIPFGHIEAGLRSGDLTAPFPEEAMRRLTAVLTRWHFAPTENAMRELMRENIPESNIFVVGNTVIDALLGRVQGPRSWPQGVPQPSEAQRVVLVTLHRRENFGAPMDRILRSIAEFARTHEDAMVVFPVHPNPLIRDPAMRTLGGLPNVHLTAPLEYHDIVSVLASAYVVFTDSGGLQEEAPALGKPVLVFRDVTERPEAVAAGGARLVGSDPGLFGEVVERLWWDERAYREMAQPRFPYGDGHAAERIVSILLRDLGGAASA